MAKIPHANQFRRSQALYSVSPSSRKQGVKPDHYVQHFWILTSLALGLSALIAALMNHLWLGLVAAWFSGASLRQAFSSWRLTVGQH